MTMHDELNRTADCIPLERLGEQLTTAEWQHLSDCSRCAAEMALYREFESPASNASETDDVAFIVQRLNASQQQPSNVISLQERKKRIQPRVLAVAAMLMVVLGIGYFVNREPSVDSGVRIDDAYRSSRVEMITPIGDVQQAPNELRWIAVAGATAYDVEVVEVDRTNLWRVSTRDHRVELPPAVIAQLVPGKTLLWQVTARRGDDVVAESGMVKFRVVTQ